MINKRLMLFIQYIKVENQTQAIKCCFCSFFIVFVCLIKETKDLATSMLATSFLVIHNASRGGQDKITKLTGRKQIGSPLFKILQLDVEARGDNTALVQTAVQLDDNLARAMIINFLKLANVTLNKTC